MNYIKENWGMLLMIVGMILFFVLLVVSLILGGNTDQIQFDGAGNIIRTVNIKGHEYLSGGSSMVHSESCPCKEKR